MRIPGIRIGKINCFCVRLDIETFPNSSRFRSKEWFRQDIRLQYDDVAETAEKSSCVEPTSWSSLLTKRIGDVLRTN